MSNSKNSNDGKKCKKGVFFPMIIILIGIMLLLKNFGLQLFPSWNGIRIFWPLGLIIIGLCIIFRFKLLATLSIILLIGLLVSNGINTFVSDDDVENFSNEITLNKSSSNLELDINFGLGEISIDSSNKKTITFDRKSLNEHSVDYNLIKDKLTISRDDSYIPKNPTEKWNLKLPKNIIYSINLDYGVTSTDLNLEDLMVDEIIISSGVTDNVIKFADYNTYVSIDSGVSDFTFKFPENVGVSLDIEGGFLDINKKGFIKKDGKYFSQNYNISKNHIEIDVNGGIIDMELEFY